MVEMKQSVEILNTAVNWWILIYLLQHILGTYAASEILICGFYKIKQ